MTAILSVWRAPEWSTPGCQSIRKYIWEVGDWTVTSDCDVSSHLFTLHYCTITSDTAAHVGRGTVLYQLTGGPSNDIPHKEFIALSLSAWSLATAGAWTAVYIFRCMAYFFLCIISMCTKYMNKYTVECNEWNSVAYNTTRRRLFCFPMS